MKTGTRKVDPLNDLAFKKVLGSEENKDILAGFVEDFFGVRPMEITITNPYDIKAYEEAVGKSGTGYSSFRETLRDVGARLDMADFTAELQVREAKLFDRRSLYYACSSFCSNYNAAYPDGALDEARSDNGNGKYASLRPVYALNILKYNHFADDQNVVRMFELYDPKRGLGFKPEYLKIGYFELLKSEGAAGNMKHWKDYFLANGLSEDAPEYIKKAEQVIEYANLTNKEREMLDYAMKVEDQRLDELDAAETRGRRAERFDNAKRMKADGVDDALISKYTGLSVEEINML